LINIYSFEQPYLSREIKSQFFPFVNFVLGTLISGCAPPFAIANLIATSLITVLYTIIFTILLETQGKVPIPFAPEAWVVSNPA
jgi:hypothetical protein